MDPHPIRLYRKFKRLTQGELAVALGCSHGMISHWENGIRPMSKEAVLKLSEMLGKPLDEIDSDISLWERKKRKSIREKVAAS